MATRAPSTRRKPISLALQGGGSWGAYTWGVLDGLLANRSLVIDQLSGTSAGAINAAIVAGALATSTPREARRRLRSFWEAVAAPASADFGRAVWGPAERRWRETVDLWLGAHALSPYQSNPLGINPLRSVIERHVDIDALRGANAMPLFVTITNVRTGLPRVIENAGMSIDALLASACLPQLFQAVEIDGEPYWDGGYSGNPTLWPMLGTAGDRDVVVVQLTPDRPGHAPRDAAGIRRRVNEIVFNASLVSEMQSIAGMRAMAGDNAQGRRVSDLRLHRIGPPPVALYAEGSPLERSHAWIARLETHGRTAARRFMARHAGDLGIRETLDVGTAFGDPRWQGRTPGREAADPRPGVR